MMGSNHLDEKNHGPGLRDDINPLQNWFSLRNPASFKHSNNNPTRF